MVQNWRISMSAIAATLGASVVVYLVGLIYCRSAPDYREELLHEPLTAPEVGHLQLIPLPDRFFAYIYSSPAASQVYWLYSYIVRR